MNGAEPIPSTLAVTFVLPSTVGKLESCTITGASSAQLPVQGLPGYSTLTCNVPHVVTNEDILRGELPTFNVTVTKTPAGGVSTEHAQSTVPAIPLFTGLPCMNCRSCLSTMTKLVQSYLAEIDQQVIANKFAAECAKSGYTDGKCSAAIALIRASPTGHFGKRAGMLCKAVGACDPAEHEASCDLSTAESFVPKGKLDVCSVAGTDGAPTATQKIPNRVQAFSVAIGLCFNTTANNTCGPSKMCDTTAVTGYQCACNSTTGAEECRPYYTCVDTPCTKCRNCIASARSFATIYKDSTNATQIAEAFKQECVASKSTGDCTTMPLKIGASYLGNMAKRPGLICKDICNDAAVLSDCVLAANSTPTGPTYYKGNYSLCSATGFTGADAGIPTLPNNTCTADAACNATNNEFCSFAAGLQSCSCNATTGVDSCAPKGLCKKTSCADCQSCLDSVGSWVKRNVQEKSADTLYSSWMELCLSTGSRSDCEAAGNAIRSSPHLNLARRAASLCSRIYSKYATEYPSTWRTRLRVHVIFKHETLEQNMLSDHMRASGRNPPADMKCCLTMCS